MLLFAPEQIEEQGRHNDRVGQVMLWPMFVSAGGINFLFWLGFRRRLHHVRTASSGKHQWESDLWRMMLIRDLSRDRGFFLGQREQKDVHTRPHMEANA